MADQVEEIKSRVNIVDLVSEYVTLKRAGRNMAGLCPFHGEKTASFMVSAERGSWHCFGCGKGGDVFSFIEEIEGLTFPETLEKLAQRAGIKLVRRPSERGSSDLRGSLFQINATAARFYNYLLTKHKIGEVGRKYLRDRQITASSLEQFQIGYAPSGNTLYSFLVKKGFPKADISASGLVVSSQKGAIFDRFRDRIMFPLFDMSGRIVAFSGRLLSEKKGEAKYLNCPNTPIFTKGGVLFGLPQAKGSVKESDEAVLVEGEFDVISSHRAGVTNVLGTKGTALTEEQVALIRRLTDNISICFDSDLAGDAAARRGIETADGAGLNIKIINIGSFHDPDEIVKTNPEAWKKSVSDAVGVYDWFLTWATRHFDVDNPTDKKKIGQILLPVFGRISDEIVKAHYLSKLAQKLSVSETAIQAALTKGNRQWNLPTPTPATAAVVGKNQVGLEEYFLALLLQGREFDCTLTVWPLLSDFSDETLKSLYGQIIMHKPYNRSAVGATDKEGQVLDLATFGTQSGEAAEKTVDRLAVLDLGEAGTSKEVWERALAKTAREIRRLKVKDQITQLSHKMKEAEGKVSEQELGKLTRRFQDLTSELALYR